jgi:monofunctional biosynthetic peptidoglycan transglycosylase
MARGKSGNPGTPRRRWGFWRFISGLIGWAFVIGVIVPMLLVAIYRFAPPPGTILMAKRVVQGKGWDYRWRSLDKISPALVQAAVASEDARFCEHHGFDFEAIHKAMEHNEKHPTRIRGASTISQQTAKNVFLWPGRDWVRKGLETYFTVLIETGWGKRRIMEVYLNVAEMGPGIYGAEAAAQKYFHTDAAHVSPSQAARLVAVLPNPLKYRAGAPGKYVQRRSRSIGGAMGTVRQAGLAECVLD